MHAPTQPHAAQHDDDHGEPVVIQRCKTLQDAAKATKLRAGARWSDLFGERT
ncbi:MAG: hypothetical protein JNK76_26830 [Planctomycetales bacterium]|nr:hypothetical protein [Planctomycetales bacterium]